MMAQVKRFAAVMKAVGDMILDLKSFYLHS